MIKLLLYVPFFLQAVVITFDEFYFHHKRGLPRWERIGHPLDTLSIVACIASVLILPYNTFNLWIFITLASVSALFVTKDEFVHKKHCPAKELWLHALLFLNHPLVLFATGFMWKSGGYAPFLTLQMCSAALFGIYQFVYWNFVRDQ